MELIFPPVEDSINLTSPHEPDSTELVPYPAWGGEYSDILQSDTCSIDNILAIISSNKTTIILVNGGLIRANDCKYIVYGASVSLYSPPQAGY